MKHAWLLTALALVLVAGAAGAEEDGIWEPEGGDGAPPKVVPETPDKPEKDHEKPAAGDLAAIRKQIEQGKLQEALVALVKVQKSTSSETTRTDALKLLADVLRKKGQWKLVPSAYEKVRDRFAEDTGEYKRYDALATIARNSGDDGVYGPIVADLGRAGVENKTIANDKAWKMAQAAYLKMVGRGLDRRIKAVSGAGSPSKVVAAVGPLAKKLADVRPIAPDVVLEMERNLVRRAGQTVEKLVNGTLARLQGEYDTKYASRVNTPWKYNSRERQIIEQTSNALQKLAAVEGRFSTAIEGLGGKEWQESDAIQKASEARARRCEQLAARYVVREYETDWQFGM